VSQRARLGILLVGLAGVAALYLWGLRGIPAPGHYRGPYGDLINAAGVRERHVTDMVTAVNFDYRALDTLGEEFILFVSAAGVAVVLRRGRREHEREIAEQDGEAADEASRRRPPPTSDAVRTVCLLMVAPVVLLGVYIAAHGQLSPGGGFQGGVILATGLLLVGVYGIVTSRHLVHLIVCLVVVQSSTYVLLLAIGYRSGAAPPVFASVSPSTPAVDPVVQAMTLTDVVVEATATALLLAFAVQAHKRFGTLDPNELRSMRE
jgi:multicomponent Na+:H+ antiporter subunit C